MSVEQWGLVFGAFSVVFGVWAYLRRHLQPKLVYRITQDRPLLSAGQLDTSDVEVRSHDVVVNEPWVWGVAFTNTGKAPIRPADFASSIWFDFNSAVAFLDVQAVGDCEVAFAKTESTVHLGITPQIINPGETLELAALFDGPLEAGPPRGKIAGVTEIELVKVGNAYSNLDFLARMLLLATVVAAFLGLFILWQSYVVAP